MDYQTTVDQQVTLFKEKYRFSVNWIVIDGYQFDRHFCKTWQEAGFKVCLFDDGIHKSPYSVDLLVNPSSERRTGDDGTPIIMGAEYRLIRQEFADVKQLPVQKRRYLTLSFGGSDPANLTYPIVAMLNKLNFHAPVRVITGQAYPYFGELVALLNKCSIDIEHLHAVQNMATVWSESKLAVSAAGGSQFELAVCATPSILVVVADNQLPASEYAAKEGWCVVADFSDDCQQVSMLSTLGSTILKIWGNEGKLVEMQESVTGKYDADGAARIVEALIAYE